MHTKHNKSVYIRSPSKWGEYEDMNWNSETKQAAVYNWLCPMFLWRLATPAIVGRFAVRQAGKYKRYSQLRILLHNFYSVYRCGRPGAHEVTWRAAGWRPQGIGHFAFVRLTRQGASFGVTQLTAAFKTVWPEGMECNLIRWFNVITFQSRE